MEGADGRKGNDGGNQPSGVGMDKRGASNNQKTENPLIKLCGSRIL